MCCQTITTPIAHVIFYFSSEQVTPVVLSAARNKGMSEVGQLLAKGLFGLCVGSVGREQGAELSPPSSSQRMWEALGLHERLWEKPDIAHMEILIL